MRYFCLAVLFTGALAPAAAAQSADDVRVPPMEIATAFTYDLHRDGTADLPGGAGALVALDGNLNDHLAIAAELSASPRMRTTLAGARVSTGFFREGRGGPGRFFAQLLAGPRRGGIAGDGAAVQLGVGADVLVVPRGLSLHWGLDYLFAPGLNHEFVGGRFSVGLVAGPHLP